MKEENKIHSIAQRVYSNIHIDNNIESKNCKYFFIKIYSVSK